LALDLSPYDPQNNETPASSAKMRNAFRAIETAFANLGGTDSSFAAGQVIPVDQLTQGGASVGQGISWNGSAWVATTFTVPIVYKKTSEKDVNTTASKTDLFNGEITIGAGDMGASSRMLIYAGGDYLNNSGNDRTINLELKLGSQVLWASGASSVFPSSSARRAWRLQAEVQAQASTSLQQGGGTFFVNDNQAATTGSGAIRAVYNTNTVYGGPFLTVATTVPMASSQALTFSVTHSASASTISMRLEYARVEII
jgi:hypothetical protein